MSRVAIALAAALGLHVLLLMTILPGHQVVEPEIKGSGHVTVSIRHSSPPPPEMVEEPVVEPEQIEQVEKTVQQEVEVQQTNEDNSIQLPVQVATPPRPEPVNDVIAPVKTVVETPMKKKVAHKVVLPESVPGKVVSPLQDISSLDDEVDSSEMESLRQPEPLEAVNHPPAYPSLARKRGWQGTVLLEVDVQSDGMVKNIQIKESSSYGLLDREAVDAVREWRFSPGLKAGKPVPMKVLVPIHYLLQDT
jgi:protein TonB